MPTLGRGSPTGPRPVVSSVAVWQPVPAPPRQNANPLGGPPPPGAGWSGNDDSKENCDVSQTLPSHCSSAEC